MNILLEMRGKLFQDFGDILSDIAIVVANAYADSNRVVHGDTFFIIIISPKMELCCSKRILAPKSSFSLRTRFSFRGSQIHGGFRFGALKQTSNMTDPVLIAAVEGGG